MWQSAKKIDMDDVIDIHEEFIRIIAEKSKLFRELLEYRNSPK